MKFNFADFKKKILLPPEPDPNVSLGEAVHRATEKAMKDHADALDYATFAIGATMGGLIDATTAMSSMSSAAQAKATTFADINRAIEKLPKGPQFDRLVATPDGKMYAFNSKALDPLPIRGLAPGWVDHDDVKKSHCYTGLSDRVHSFTHVEGGGLAPRAATRLPAAPATPPEPAPTQHEDDGRKAGRVARDLDV